MRFSWIVPTYNEGGIINDKLTNLIELSEISAVFRDSEFIVADNGSCDNTVDIAQSFSQVKVLEVGRVGKYLAVHHAVSKLDSDWTILSDANVMVRAVDSKSLSELFHEEDTVVVYGLIRRASTTFVNVGDFPPVKIPFRLLLDVKFGYSSGAYGGLYAVRTSVLKKAISLPPVQNDDYFIAVSATQYGIPNIGQLYGEEIESMTFRDEFFRKMRDAQGHLQAIIEISTRIGCKRSKIYALTARIFIWTSITVFLAINGLVLIAKPLLIVGFLLGLCFEKVRVFYARLFGFLCGFISGPFLAKKIVWETARK